eukprot:4542881-Pleurochrysis_carterae.AAC.2
MLVARQREERLEAGWVVGVVVGKGWVAEGCTGSAEEACDRAAARRSRSSGICSRGSRPHACAGGRRRECMLRNPSHLPGRSGRVAAAAAGTGTAVMARAVVMVHAVAREQGATLEMHRPCQTQRRRPGSAAAASTLARMAADPESEQRVPRNPSLAERARGALALRAVGLCKAFVAPALARRLLALERGAKIAAFALTVCGTAGEV